MKITSGLLREANAKGLPVEIATDGRLTDDGTKARDEQNLELVHLFHDFSSRMH
jgi:hypothetical protein